MNPLEFSFQDLLVGRFRESAFPSDPGRYRYEPYRGRGHHDLCAALDASGAQRCIYQQGDQCVSFLVRSIPEYGILELDDFQVASRSA